MKAILHWPVITIVIIMVNDRTLTQRFLKRSEYKHTSITVQIATGLGHDVSNKRIAPSFPRKISSLAFTDKSGSHAKTAKYDDLSLVAIATK